MKILLPVLKSVSHSQKAAQETVEAAPAVVMVNEMKTVTFLQKNRKGKTDYEGEFQITNFRTFVALEGSKSNFLLIFNLKEDEIEKMTDA